MRDVCYDGPWRQPSCEDCPAQAARVSSAGQHHALAFCTGEQALLDDGVNAPVAIDHLRYTEVHAH